MVRALLKLPVITSDSRAERSAARARRKKWYEAADGNPLRNQHEHAMTLKAKDRSVSVGMLKTQRSDLQTEYIKVCEELSAKLDAQDKLKKQGKYRPGSSVHFLNEAFIAEKIGPKK